MRRPADLDGDGVRRQDVHRRPEPGRPIAEPCERSLVSRGIERRNAQAREPRARLGERHARCQAAALRRPVLIDDPNRASLRNDEHERLGLGRHGAELARFKIDSLRPKVRKKK